MSHEPHVITDDYALYNGDCCEILRDLPDQSIHLSVYSPPFCGLYHYSSSERDMSNCRSREEFLEHYGFLVRELSRLTIPGRLSAVHVADIPVGDGVLYDFAGDVIRLHESHGWHYVARHAIWKPPLQVRMRTMARGLAHRTVCEDSSLADVAGADSVLMFRRRGTNPIPITHPTGLLEYAGARPIPAEVLPYRGWEGDQTENRYSHWIWRQYASAFWDDIRIDHVLPYKEAKEEDDEKHVHPLQLDVIDRVVTLRSNPGETVITPFMGVGSEVYSAVRNGRRAVGVELKASYYRQAVKNAALALTDWQAEQAPLFADMEGGSGDYLGKPGNSVVKNPHSWKPKKTRREMSERVAD